MVVKMMRWRPWPPLATKKFEVKLILRSLQGWQLEEEKNKLTVEIRWKGQKLALSSLRRATVKRNFTKEVDQQNGVVNLDDEEFHSVCTLSSYKDNNVFYPWEITFSLLNGVNQGQKKQVSIIGTASLNLADFAVASQQQDFDLNIPLILSSTPSDILPSLCMSLSLLELRTTQEATDTVPRTLTSPPQVSENDKDEISAIKAGLRKVKIFTEYVSTRRAKKACREEDGSEGRCSVRSEDGDDYNYPFDSDSLDEFEEGETDESKEDATVRKSFSYGTLAYANCAGGSFYSNARINAEDEDWVYYSNRKSDVGCSHVDDSIVPVSEPPPFQSSKRSILPWRKRKMSFRSPKAKGEPLLKKGNDEEGGDDIDFDRRQLSSDESLSLQNKTDEDSSANRTSVSEFGDDNFAIGSWELKEVISREGHMKLESQVFFASIDQRSERAAGESACTALVAVMADWFQNNRDLMPIKSQFDSLIRDGSLEWRNLCENETYRERFPDKHFDLETVLQAKIRPLSVIPGKSFIGFFHPEGIEEERFEFLHGAMSFDNIWDEISEYKSDGEPPVYVVSWNDHFFLLKVEREAYYIIDTLGERLYEGCNQAYILKFDSSTVIRKLAPSSDNQNEENCEVVVVKREEEEEEEEVVCRGKECCKEYIKSFLAAIPIRELHADIKKGLMATAPLLHQRLQIEFHYTKSFQLTMT